MSTLWIFVVASIDVHISLILYWDINWNISRNDSKKLLCVYSWVLLDMEIESVVLLQLSAQLDWYTAWFEAFLLQLMVLCMMFVLSARISYTQQENIAVWNIIPTCINMLLVTCILILNDTADALECIEQPFNAYIRILCRKLIQEHC